MAFALCRSRAAPVKALVHVGLGALQDPDVVTGALKAIESADVQLRADFSHHAAQLWYLLADASAAVSPVTDAAPDKYAGLRIQP